MYTLENSISKKINSNLVPFYFRVINESHMHTSSIDAESHFKLIIVSSFFDEKNMLQRHRMIYDLLAYELSNGVHALSIHTYTKCEWQEKSEINSSPLCVNKKI
tara:strand:- start:205 stop:516 length:312 start_codon:yes stop_codon:yes gene_type:complete